jgi:hypothetical protein
MPLLLLSILLISLLKYRRGGGVIGLSLSLSLYLLIKQALRGK